MASSVNRYRVHNEIHFFDCHARSLLADLLKQAHLIFGICREGLMRIGLLVVIINVASAISAHTASAQMTPEQQIVVGCAASYGSTPEAAAGCVVAKLTTRELLKCLTDGIGGGGCFGNNNTLVQILTGGGGFGPSPEWNAYAHRVKLWQNYCGKIAYDWCIADGQPHDCDQGRKFVHSGAHPECDTQPVWVPPQ